MSLHVHLEAIVTDIDMKTRRWQSFVSDFEPWNSIHDVMHYHDEVINDPKRKIVKVWEARRMQSARNKVRRVQSFTPGDLNTVVIQYSDNVCL